MGHRTESHEFLNAFDQLTSELRGKQFQSARSFGPEPISRALGIPQPVARPNPAVSGDNYLRALSIRAPRDNVSRHCAVELKDSQFKETE
jgi:hypothetical protein